MKKYLMTGIAAVAMCAAFTSCSHDIEPMSQEEIDQFEAEKVLKNYEAAFIAAFGQPAANQTWGFGPAAAARTRALSDMTAGANKNRNLWAATDGNFKLIVPTPLTTGQKLRVKAYFQAHPNLTWEQPDMTNYFVQQVYTGNPTTAGANSTEQYTATNGQTFTGSGAMNYLYINGVHVSDFNKGDNPNTAKDVLNNGEKTNSDNKHSDQITLMIGVTPTYVGFADSEGSTVHEDCMALAGAKAIDDWAKALDTPIGEDVYYGKDQYGYDNSYWERSFVGLDYEALTADGLYNTYKDNPKAMDFLRGGSDYILYNGEIVAASSFVDFYLTDSKGNKIKYLVDDVSNKTIATYLKNADNSNVTKDAYNYSLTKEQFAEYNVTITNSSANIFNLDMIIDYVRNQHALPTSNNGNWVKNIGGRDYVFSDWIVTLAPAKEQTIIPVPETISIRIMAEDLTADDKSDFDFNDVVFDVTRIDDNTASITLQAAGGTLPLRINQNDLWEVHKLFDVPVNTMVNTGAENKGMTGASKPAVPVGNITINGGFSEANFYNTVKNEIKIEVKKGNSWVEMKAPKGQAFSKFGCRTNQHWVGERDDIDTQYNFTEWVTGLAYTLEAKH